MLLEPRGGALYYVRKSFTGDQFSQLSKEGKEEPLGSTARRWEYNREPVAGGEK